MIEKKSSHVDNNLYHTKHRVWAVDEENKKTLGLN